MGGNLMLIHGGGPTAVLNASLYGAITEAKRHGDIGRILAAKGGTGGLLRDEVLDLTDLPADKLSLLLTTPGSAIGTSRDALDAADYARMRDMLAARGVFYTLMGGGNGTMDACGKLCARCQGTHIRVIGIPKTMDNDIAVTDHAPGYSSAARYIAQSVAEVAADVRGLPIHAVVVETCGRNAGWIAAASALARQAGVDAPDLIYLPERPFEEEKFLRDVERLIARKRGIVVVASEGLKDAAGKTVVPPVYQTGRATYFGDVGAHLAMLIVKELGYKARSEKPGLLGRASVALASEVDRAEAVLAGREAVRAAVAGETGKMVGFVRESDDPYRARATLIDVREVMLREKTMPDEFINAEGNGVTEAFLRWCAPLIGPPLCPLVTFQIS